MILYKNTSNQDAEAYIDANYVRSKDNKRSNTDFVIIVGGKMTASKNKKQNVLTKIITSHISSKKNL
ncbi:hypothetical protein AXF42_Ash010701 [Apostasia shenzhenica]|uniref:Uncharacterized protein n=1 Tax=Apostasia shenzhenica TaxID=1088818 RepID=A0A2I0A6U6_9ASPA|nr:hypothetical protein AXF42_Ash010701 [Apostasia shenzhenica]